MCIKGGKPISFPYVLCKHQQQLEITCKHAIGTLTAVLMTSLWAIMTWQPQLRGGGAGGGGEFRRAPATAQQHVHKAVALLLAAYCVVPIHSLMANLFLGHDDGDSLSIELRPACSPNHLQAGAAVVLLVPGCVCTVTAPPAGALQDYQVCWQVHSHGQSGGCAQHLYGCMLEI